MDKLKLEKKKKRISLIASAILATVVIGVVSPFILIALKGALGILGLMVAYGVGAAMLYFTPVVSMKFANWRLKAFKEEATKNPVETLQNQQIELENALEVEKGKIMAFSAAIETFKGKLSQESQYQPEAAAAGIPILRDMERLFKFRVAKFRKAQKDVAERRSKVRLAESRYRIALAAQAVSRAADITEGTVLNSILEDVAFGSIDETVHMSLADLRSSISLEELPADDAYVRVLDKETPRIETTHLSQDQVLKELNRVSVEID